MLYFIMADEPKKGAELADVMKMKALAERGQSFKNRAELLKALDAIGFPATANAQKLAAETSEVDVDLANAWFFEHWKEPRSCPICKQNTWAIVRQFLRAMS
jgi:uncharacterized UBP type Zn finger protein